MPAFVYRPRAATAAAAAAIAAPQLRRHGDRRRLFHDLLVAPLNRTLALDERDDRPVRIAEQLDLDVPGIARCGARDIRRSRRTPTALRTARSGRPPRAPSASSTVRIPLPPPPDTALTSSGYPTARRNRRAFAFRHRIRERLVGARHDRRRRHGLRPSRAAVLLPMAAIASGDGPMKVNPASRQARANAAFSARNPYPGCTASAPDSPRRVQQRVDAEIAAGSLTRPDAIRLVCVANVARVRGRIPNTPRPTCRPISRHARMMRTAISPRLAIADDLHWCQSGMFAVLLRRDCLLSRLVLEPGERGDQLRGRVCARLDHFVDEAARRRHVRVGKLLPELGHPLRARRLRVRRRIDLALVQDVDRAFGPHHRDLRASARRS